MVFKMKFIKLFLDQKWLSIKPVVDILNELLGFGGKALYIDHLVQTNIANCMNEYE